MPEVPVPGATLAEPVSLRCGGHATPGRSAARSRARVTLASAGRPRPAAQVETAAEAGAPPVATAEPAAPRPPRPERPKRRPWRDEDKGRRGEDGKGRRDDGKGRRGDDGADERPKRPPPRREEPRVVDGPFAVLGALRDKLAQNKK